MINKILNATSKVTFYLGWPIVYMAFRNSTRAYVLIESAGQVLFVKSRFGDQKYKLPGGGVKKNENPADGLIRELFEETAIKLDVSQLTEISNKIQSYHGATYKHIMFSANLNKQAWPKARKIEIMEAVWLNPDHIDKSHFSRITIQALKTAGYGR